MSRRRAECEFHLGPAQARSLGVPTGYLTGFIDLVFAHGGALYVVDWKSNHLGWSAADYAGPPLRQVVEAQGYDRQAAIYARAAEGLQARRPGTTFGGAFCLFLRGTRPAWQDAAGRPHGVAWLTAAAGRRTGDA
jgi:exodeoxyribonuclease V beta subunit